MQVWLLDVDRFVSLNKLNPVTNPIGLDKGMIPTPDGVFSTEIFGMSVYDRKHTFSYIPLKRKFITPKAFITLKSLNRNFEACIFGTKKFSIVEGKLVPDDENGKTGIDFLYNNWEKIKFAKNDSNKRSQRIDVITNNKKDIIFIDKFVVIPAFYRDINLQNPNGNTKVPEINDLYNAIIRNTVLIESSNNFEMVINSLIGKVQSLMVDVYNLLKEKIQGKTGYLRQFVIGKSVDYCSRILITAVSYDTNSAEDQEIDFYHTGMPLSFAISEFAPYIIWYVKRYFKNRFVNNQNKFPAIVHGEQVYVKIENPESYYNEEYIESKLDGWVHNPGIRFDPIESPPIAKEDKEKYGIKEDNFPLKLVGYNTSLTTMQKEENKIERDMTWTDLFYIAAVDVTADKHIIVTRYPVTDYLGLFITKPAILSTRQTMPMVINDHLYKNYPVIDPNVDKSNLDALFVDAYKICPVYLPAINGDHDGDQVTSKPIFSQEANQEAEELMMKKQNLVSLSGNAIRKFGNEGIQTLYTMTNFH